MKTSLSLNSILYACQLVAAAMSLALLGGCEVLRPAVSAQPTLYTLTGVRSTVITAPSAQSVMVTAPTLMVGSPQAAAGFNSRHIMYVRQADQLEYFAHSEWIDTPARMLAPLIIGAVESSGAFRAVVQTPSVATGEIRLDIEILRLQHEFLSSPSRVRFTLRAYLVDSRTRRVIATREFETVVTAGSEDPYGGVVAANRAVQTALENLATFCAEAMHTLPMEK